MVKSKKAKRKSVANVTNPPSQWLSRVERALLQYTAKPMASVFTSIASLTAKVTSLVLREPRGLDEVIKKLREIDAEVTDHRQWMTATRMALRGNRLAHRKVPTTLAAFLHAVVTSEGAFTGYGDYIVRCHGVKFPYALIFAPSGEAGYVAVIRSTQWRFDTAVGKCSLVAESAYFGGRYFVCSFKPIDTNSPIVRRDINEFLDNTQAPYGYNGWVETALAASYP